MNKLVRYAFGRKNIALSNAGKGKKKYVANSWLGTGEILNS